MYTNNPTSNNHHNKWRIIIILGVLLALLLCLRVCKQKATETPTSPALQQTALSQVAVQRCTKKTFAFTQNKTGRLIKQRRKIKKGKTQHQEQPAKRNPIKKTITPEDKSMAKVMPTKREQTERSSLQQSEQPNESQPAPLSEQKAEHQEELPTIVNELDTMKRKTKSEHKPAKRLSARYKSHTQSRIGIRAGAGYASIVALGEMIEDYSIRPHYTLEEHGSTVPTLGLFVLLRQNRLAVELAADYTWLSANLVEHKQAGNIHEKTMFRYHVIIPQVALRLYLLDNFYMGAGVALALPTNPGGLDFTSDRPNMLASADKLIQAHLRETLRAKPQATPLVKVGYSSFKNGIEASLQYGYGLTDLIKTNDNPYGYHPARNNCHLFLLTVGYTIPIKHILKSTR